MERRTALALLVHGGSAAVASLVGIPTLIYVLAPSLRSDAAERWGNLGALDLFTIGTVRAAAVELSPAAQATEALPPGVYVWRVSEQEIVVFSRSCTDLGCPLTFDPGSECFFCPCHGGIFSKSGEPMAGPPDRPLYRYQTRVENGELQVDLNSVPPIA